MLKGGIFLDMENLSRCGGWNIRFDAVRRLVEAQGVTIVRANAYMVVDEEREGRDEEYFKKKQEYRTVVRRAGFKVALKPIKRFLNDEEQWVFKSNADIDLVTDALTQTDDLDYILLGTGDGDFVRLVRSLQMRGKRVDVLSFANTDEELRREADMYLSGYLYPEILPSFEKRGERMRGYLHMVNEEKGFGFLTVQTGLHHGDPRTDVFLHITDIDEELDNREFALLKTHENVIEFTFIDTEDGKFQAKDAIIIE